MVIQIKFRGIDDWNRPVFKVAGEKYSSMHFGSVTQLFPWNTPAEEVIEKINVAELEYFGDRFGCEPEGGMFKGLELEIIK